MLKHAPTLAVLIVAALMLWISPVPAMSAVFLATILPAFVFAQHFPLSRNSQSFLGLAALAVGLLLPRPYIDQSFIVPGILSVHSFTLGAASLLVAATRLYLQRPVGGVPGTMAAALIALTACGRTDSGGAFVIAAIAFVVVALLAIRYGDSARPKLIALGWRHRAGAVLGIAVTAGLGGGLAWAIPIGQQWAMGRITQRMMRQTGFSDVLWLGSLEGMLQSERVVMRVRGEPVNHLRGAVYTNYERSRWAHEVKDSHSQIALPQGPTATEGVTEIELSGKVRRYFAPLDTGEIAVATGLARSDRMGVISAVAGTPAKRLWFQPGAERAPPVGEVTAADTHLPVVRHRHGPAQRLRDRLRPLALEWTKGATTTRAKLEALETHLQTQFEYSLEFEHDPTSEPVLAFLLERKSGHCEYFASAMALLARSIDIPARVAGGYRVAEVNELGGYHIVRERDAHTWVEAWVPDEGWSTFDPTPSAPFAVESRTTTPLLSSLLDLAATGWERVDDWIAERTTEELIVVLLILMALLPLLRWLRNRQRSASKTKATEVTDRALPCFEELTELLARHGLKRAAAEPIERFARRIEQTDAAGPRWREEATKLLRAYAALRYGGVGDESELVGAIQRLRARAE